MPLSVEDEVSQIEAITDIRSIRDKRSSRKGKITHIVSQAQALLHVPTRKLKVSELQKKLEEANRSSTLFDTLQVRYEILASESVTDFNAASESASGDQTQQEIETVME